ncbi:MAG: hypothetical protein KC766_32715 [Myxococcales bacterium]|nr:hypothetical protein [Myxococcales bacterium]
MKQVVFESPLVTIEEDPTERLIWVRRSTERCDVERLMATYADAMSQITRSHRGWGMILDMREAPGNNSDAFENSTAELRAKLSDTFPRVVVLVSTVVGELQVKRMARESELETAVTTDEAHARRICRT